jgi:ERF superfamily
MLTSTPCTDLLAALCAARLDFPTITRNREGFSKRTGQKYQYADLNAIIDTTEPILGQHGLLMIQSLEDGEWGTLKITSTLFHTASGQWVSSEVSVEKPGDM